MNSYLFTKANSSTNIVISSPFLIPFRTFFSHLNIINEHILKLILSSFFFNKRSTLFGKMHKILSFSRLSFCSLVFFSCSLAHYSIWEKKLNRENRTYINIFNSKNHKKSIIYCSFFSLFHFFLYIALSLSLSLFRFCFGLCFRKI